MFQVTATQSTVGGLGVGAINLRAFYPQYEPSPLWLGVLVPTLEEADELVASLPAVTHERGIRASVVRLAA